MRMFWFRAAALAVLAAGNIVFPVNAEAVTLPPANGQFDYQLKGAYDPEPTVAIVVRDRKAKPFPGKYNICYVNTFQTQKEEAGWWIKNHPDLLARKDGKIIEDPKWKKEYLLDTSNDEKRKKLIKYIIGPWIDQCAADGFNAIEPDNLDSFERSKGVLTIKNNADFAELLVKRAHAANLAIAQKNTTDLIDNDSNGPSKKIGFDFAIAEECEYQSECDVYRKGYGDLVYEIEYNDNKKDKNGKPVDPRSYFEAACEARGKEISVIYRDRYVVPDDKPEYEYDWCK